MTTKDLVEAARDYAKHDEYSITRNYINALCNEIDRLAHSTLMCSQRFKTTQKPTVMQSVIAGCAVHHGMLIPD